MREEKQDGRSMTIQLEARTVKRGENARDPQRDVNRLCSASVYIRHWDASSRVQSCMFALRMVMYSITQVGPAHPYSSFVRATLCSPADAECRFFLRLFFPGLTGYI